MQSHRSSSSSARRAPLLASCAALPLLVGCVASPVSLAASTKPLAPGTYTEVGPTSGRSYAVSLFGIPLSEPNPSGTARDRAIASSNADALIGVAVDSITVPLGPLTIAVTNVYGTAVLENN